MFGTATTLPFDIIACGAALLHQPHFPDLGADALVFPALHTLLAVYQATSQLQGTARYMAVVEVLALHRWNLTQLEGLPARRLTHCSSCSTFNCLCCAQLSGCTCRLRWQDVRRNCPHIGRWTLTHWFSGTNCCETVAGVICDSC